MAGGHAVRMVGWGVDKESWGFVDQNAGKLQVDKYSGYAFGGLEWWFGHLNPGSCRG